ncbi:MAG: choline dehydrogenase-like flavoprotein [Granulosicoccus sp.]|jgi:choline dehydrogenase-like flavoprotein
MKHQDTADVVIIGAGAAGAAFAWRLSGMGLNIVCLEQGYWVKSEASPSQDENWELALQTRFHPNPNIRKAPSDYPVDTVNSDIEPANYNAVGGSTIRWGAHFPRLHPSDFKVATLDGVGCDWPISYSDLEPYYDLNDQMMGVCGLAGDPANPPRTPRPFPPLPLCTGTTRLQTAFDQLGWHWWPSDAAIQTQDSDSRQACNFCGPCGLGCPRKARASVDITYWPLAIKQGVTLKTGCTVLQVNTNSKGTRAESVHYIDASGEHKMLVANTIVLAASGMGTPRLLLASLTNKMGSNSSDRLSEIGRNLMLHPTAIVSGVFSQSLKTYQGPFACSLFSQEFYETDLRRGFVRGCQLQALRSQGPLGTALGGYMSRLPWGTDHHERFTHGFNHTVSITVTSEDLPEPSNFIDLAVGDTDSRGMVIPRMHYKVGENTQKILHFGIAKATELLRAAGAHNVNVNPLSRQAGFHFMGTARMGNDEDKSVVSAEGRCHAINNILVIDGSVFPSAGAVNPTSTLQAFALRCADALLDTLIPTTNDRLLRHGS